MSRADEVLNSIYSPKKNAIKVDLVDKEESDGSSKSVSPATQLRNDYPLAAYKRGNRFNVLLIEAGNILKQMRVDRDVS